MKGGRGESSFGTKKKADDGTEDICGSGDGESSNYSKQKEGERQWKKGGSDFRNIKRRVTNCILAARMGAGDLLRQKFRREAHGGAERPERKGTRLKGTVAIQTKTGKQRPRPRGGVQTEKQKQERALYMKTRDSTPLPKRLGGARGVRNSSRTSRCPIFYGAGKMNMGRGPCDGGNLVGLCVKKRGIWGGGRRQGMSNP